MFLDNNLPTEFQILGFTGYHVKKTTFRDLIGKQAHRFVSWLFPQDRQFTEPELRRAIADAEERVLSSFQHTAPMHQMIGPDILANFRTRLFHNLGLSPRFPGIKPSPHVTSTAEWN